MSEDNIVDITNIRKKKIADEKKEIKAKKREKWFSWFKTQEGTKVKPDLPNEPYDPKNDPWLQ